MKYLFEYDNNAINLIKEINNAKTIDELLFIKENLNYYSLNENILRKIKDYLIKKIKDFFNTSIEIEHTQEILAEYSIPLKDELKFTVYNTKDISNTTYKISNIFKSYNIPNKKLQKIKHTKGKIIVYNYIYGTNIEYIGFLFARTPEFWDVDYKLYNENDFENILPFVKIIVKNPNKDTYKNDIIENYKKVLKLYKDYDKKLNQEDKDFNHNLIKPFLDIIALTF